MRAYARGERCLMQLLQESLDDPSAEPCGRCSVCRGALPDALGAGRRRRRPWPTVTAAAARRRRTCWSRARCGRAARSAPRGRIPPTDGRAGPHAGLRRRPRVARDGCATLFARDAPAPAEVRRRLRAPARASGGTVVAGPARGGGRPAPPAGCRADRLGGRPPRHGRAPRPRRPWPARRRRPDLRELSSSDEAAFWRDHLDAGPRRPATVAGPGRCCWSWTPPPRCGRSRWLARCCAGRRGRRAPAAPAPPAVTGCRSTARTLG